MYAVTALGTTVAEQERLTKAERREQKRLKRQEEERVAAQQASRDRRRNISYAVSLVAVVGVLVYFALGNVTTAAEVTLARSDAEDARSSAGCEALDVGLITDEDTAPLGVLSRAHLEPATAPPADSLYVKGRPTASGPHFEQPLPIVNGVREQPIDERGSTHNLEHGSILVWFDPEQVPAEDVDDIGAWVSDLNESGFAENSGRAGIMASPISDEVTLDKPLAIRAWGVAMDCDSWDRDWANAFTIDNFGTNGNAPEAFIGVYPDEVLNYGDAPVGDEPADDEEPTDDGASTGDGESTGDGASEGPADAGSTDEG